MNRIAKIAGGTSLAIGMAFMTSAAAAVPSKQDGPAQETVRFFLADPELGVAGVYTADGKELYFEARRTVDPKSGAPGALSLRVVDGEARTVALAGEPFAEHWIPQQDMFTKNDRFAYSHLLSGLGEALESADLHASLSAEKSALADLAMRAAHSPAGGFPVRVAADASKSAAVDVSQVTDFYMQSVKDIKVDRNRDGMLEAQLGNGIVLLSTQAYIANEPDEYGQMGRIDAYSMVKTADGYVLVSELGGDELPKGWSEAIERVTDRDHHELAADFGRAATALNALAYSGKSTRGVTLSHQGEQDAMHRMAQALITNLLPERGDSADPLEIGAEASQKAGGRYRTYIQVWRKPFVIIAQHSGTRVGKWLYRSSTSSIRTHRGWTYFCNHGTCPASGNMSRKCTYTGPRLGYYRMPRRRSVGNGSTCATPYWAIGRRGHHNCHDDSATQVKAVRGQYYSVYTGRCGDSVYWMYAPTCGWQ